MGGRLCRERLYGGFDSFLAVKTSVGHRMLLGKCSRTLTALCSLGMKELMHRVRAGSLSSPGWHVRKSGKKKRRWFPGMAAISSVCPCALETRPWGPSIRSHCIEANIPQMTLWDAEAVPLLFKEKTTSGISIPQRTHYSSPERQYQDHLFIIMFLEVLMTIF